MCVCARACMRLVIYAHMMRACVRACMNARMCMRACVRASVLRPPCTNLVLHAPLPVPL